MSHEPRKEREQEHAAEVRSFERIHVPLYRRPKGHERTPMMELLTKAFEDKEKERQGASKQDPNPGHKIPPFDFDVIKSFKEANPYHSTCIDTKTQAAVGLGFVTESEKKEREEAKRLKAQPPVSPAGQGNMGIQPPQQAKGVNKEDMREEDRMSKAEMVLDPLCEVSFQSVLNQAIEDFEQTGNGFIEVVRRGDEITGLHYLPSGDVRIVIEDNSYQGHYEILTSNGACGDTSSTYKVFARFGDKESLIERLSSVAGNDADQISEVIHFKETTSLSRWYGVPKWLAAVAGIELFQCLHQHEFDFFQNRGVPEFMLFLLGAKLPKDQWETLMDAMDANIGVGNSHKSVALNINDREMNIQLEKLGLEAGSDQGGFKDRVDTLALEIVSAHRVPPLLAGIQIPGKLGAANEIVSAMKAFQTLVIGPKQKIIETTLANTLGAKAKNGGLKLGRGDFELRKITDEMEVEQLDTVSRMRQEFNGPQNQGRDPKEGLKD
jgi:PBSX family phage portal protein